MVWFSDAPRVNQDLAGDDPRCRYRGVAIAMLAAAAPLDATAQTLTDPSGPKRPAAPANKPATARMKSCSQYGPGFVYMPATDTCIKIGGYVEGGMGAGG